MKIILRKTLVSLLGLISFLASIQISYAQNEKCNPVPVKEAVRNGDFEKGYVNGTGKTYLSGGAVDFTHQFTWPYAYAGNNTQCIWGAANQAGVARNQKHKCGYGPYIGFKYYGNAKFRDHTPGKNGNGFALILDMVGKQTKTAWRQNTTVYANQKYYFSAWFAKYTAGNWVGKLRFYVTGNKTKKRVLVSSANMSGGLLQWKQFSGTWNSDNNTAATLEVVFVGSGITNADDFVIDDISFINGCQKIKNFVSYEAQFANEEISLCYNNGSYKAQVKKDDGTNLGSTGKGITWYKGAGNTQTEIVAFKNQDAPNITEAGTYRACIVDTKNGGCTVNASIVLTEDLAVTLPATAELCDPAQVTIDTKRTEAGLVHDWIVPTGATKSTTTKQVVNVGGNYTVNVSLPSNTNCNASATTKVNSKLPTIPTNLTYCEGGGEKTALKHQNKTWKWCKDKDCKTAIGKGTSVNYTLPAGTSGDQVVYMQSAVTTNAGTVGPNAVSKYPTGTGANTVFNVYQAIYLTSVQVQSVAWSGSCKAGGSKPNVTFTVTGPDGFRVSKVVRITCGSTTTAQLGFDIPKGNGYRLIVSGGKSFNFGPISRRAINGVILLGTGNTVFKNWVIRKSEACAPVAVTLKSKQCCLVPESVSVKASDEELCPGEKSNLSVVDVTYKSGENASMFDAYWVKGTKNDAVTANKKTTKISNLTDVDAGSYTYVVVDKAKPTNIGCTKTSTVTLTKAPTTTKAAAGTDEKSLCADEYTLKGNAVSARETGKWTVVSGTGTFTDDTSPTSKVTNLSVGDNVFKWTITGVCTPASEDEVTITRKEPISGGSLAAISPTVVDICANTNDHAFEVTGIKGTKPVYSWTMPTNVTQNGTGNSIKINAGDVKGGTSEDLKVSVTGDCSGSIDLKISLNWNALPDITNAKILDIDDICVSNSGAQTFEITGIVGTVDKVEWSAFEASNQLTVSDVGTKITPVLTDQLTFKPTETSKTLTIKAFPQNACNIGATNPISISKTFKVDNVPTEAVISVPNDEVCVIETVKLTGNTPTIGKGTWEVQGNTQSTVVNVNDGGSVLTGLKENEVFSAKWIIRNGACPASEKLGTVTGKGIAKPSISLTILPEKTVCEGTEIILEATGSNGGDNPKYEFLDDQDNPLTGTVDGTDFKFTPAVGELKVKVRFTSSSSCVSDKTPKETKVETIIVQEAPKDLVITIPVPASGDVFETCEETIVLESTVTAGTIKWNTTPINGVGTITDDGSGKGTVTAIPEKTIVEVQVIASGGSACTDLVETIKIDQKGAMTPAKLGDDYSVCESDVSGEVTIDNNSGTLSTGENGTWSGDSHLTIKDEKVNGLKIGKNTIIYSIDNGNPLCEASIDTVVITVDEQPKAPTFTTPLSTCESSVILKGVNPNTNLNAELGNVGNWIWEVVSSHNSGENIFTDEMNPTTEITNLSSDGNNKTVITLKGTITNGKCSAQGTMTINQFGAMTSAKLGDDYSVCESDALGEFTIDNKSGTLSTDEVGTWTGDTHLSITDDGKVSGLKLGKNTITYSIDNGVPLCEASTDTVVITVDEQPKAPTFKTPLSTCESSVTLEGVNPNTSLEGQNIGTSGDWKWEVVSPNNSGENIFTDEINPTTEIINLSSDGNNKTVITLKGTITNGECSAEGNMIINQFGAMTSAKLSDDYPICELDALGEITIDNNSGTLNTDEVGTWTGDAHLSITDDGKVSGLKVGKNTITYSIDNGVPLCEASIDTVVITVDEQPYTPTFTDLSTCKSNIILQGVNPNTSLGGQNLGTTGDWKWTVVSPSNTEENLFTDAINPTTEITNLSSDGNNKTLITLKGTITNGECSAEGTTTINQLGTVPEISFDYLSKTYKDKDEIKDAGKQLCINETPMSISISGVNADHIGTWTGATTGITLNTSDVNNLGVSFSQVGNYTLTYSLAKKSDLTCATSATLKITSIAVPADPVATSIASQIFCEGEQKDFAVLSGTNADSYTWTNSFGLDNSSITEQASYTFSSENIGTIEVHTTNICGNSNNSAEFNVEVVSPGKITSIISNMGGVCVNGTLDLNNKSKITDSGNHGVKGDVPNIIKWYDSSTGTQVSSTNVSNYTIATSKSFDVKISNQYCDESKSETKTTKFDVIKPEVKFQDEDGEIRVDGSNRFICLGNNGHTLRDVGNGNAESYKWTVYGVPQTETTGILVLDNALVDGLLDGQKIKLTKTVEGCVTDFESEITVYAIPKVSSKVSVVSDRDYVCENELNDPSKKNEVELKVTDAGIGQGDHYTTTYLWNIGNSTTQDIVVTKDGGGQNYEVDVTHVADPTKINLALDEDEIKTCAGKAQPYFVSNYDITVGVDDIEEIDAQEGEEMTTVQAVLLGSTEPSYTWTIGSYDGTTIGFDKSIEVTLNDLPKTGTVYLTATYEECIDKTEGIVQVLEEIVPPNVFTPNGDGVHDTWEISGLETYEEALITIYNRWGNVVFETYGRYSGNKEWNGKKNNDGGEVTVGVYYYVIDLNQEGRKPVTGHINVVK